MLGSELVSDFNQVISDLESTVGIVSNSNFVEPMTTSSLALDLLCFGRMSGGLFVTCFGKEQSAKSTTADDMLAYHVAQHVKIRRSDPDMVGFMPFMSKFDYEGSFDAAPDGLFMNMVRKYLPNAEYDEVFGVKDATGNYEYAPTFRYYKLSKMEAFFDMLHSMSKKLPDLRVLNGDTYAVYPKTEEARKKYADKGMYKKTGLLWCPIPEGLKIPFQVFVSPDSYPAMLPACADDDEANKQMALLAREFAKQIPRVKGAFRDKRIITWGINQYREKPGFTMGSNLYEPCGGALRFASDYRLGASAISLSTAGIKAKAGESLEREESVLHPNLQDSYSYIQFVTAKNKIGGLDRLQVRLRLWRASGKKMGLGLDPAYDTYQALKMLNMIDPKSTRNKIKLLDCFGLEQATKAMTWTQFKTLALVPMVTTSQVSQVLHEIGLPQMKPFDLRSKLRKGILYGDLVPRFKAGLMGDVSFRVDEDEEIEIEASDDDVEYS
jgi:RecA/RadA recombinase